MTHTQTPRGKIHEDAVGQGQVKDIDVVTFRENVWIYYTSQGSTGTQLYELANDPDNPNAWVRTPIASDDVLPYVAAVQGYVYAIRAGTFDVLEISKYGTTSWQATMPFSAKASPSCNIAAYASDPGVSRIVSFAGSDGGPRLWTFTAPQVGFAGTWESSPLDASLTPTADIAARHTYGSVGGPLCVHTGGGAFDAATNKTSWTGAGTVPPDSIVVDTKDNLNFLIMLETGKGRVIRAANPAFDPKDVYVDPQSSSWSPSQLASLAGVTASGNLYAYFREDSDAGTIRECVLDLNGSVMSSSLLTSSFKPLGTGGTVAYAEFDPLGQVTRYLIHRDANGNVLQSAITGKTGKDAQMITTPIWPPPSSPSGG